MFPQFPLRFAGAIGIIHGKAIALRFGEFYGDGQLIRRFGVQKAARIGPIDGFAGEIISRGVFQLNPHIMRFWGNLN